MSAFNPNLAAIEALLCRHDFHRSAYATMLELFSLEQVREFYGRFPLTIGDRVFSGQSLLEHLWSEKNMITVGWNYHVVDAFEDYFVELGYTDPFAFMRKVLRRNNNSTYIPGKTIFTWFYPKMSRVFSPEDPIEMMFRFIPIFTEQYLPQHFHQRIHKTQSASTITSYLCYCTMKDLSGSLPFNFDLIAGPQVQSCPAILNLPPFDSISYHTDARSPFQILKDGYEHEDKFFYQNRVIAESTSLRKHCEGFSFPVPIEDIPVFVARVDVFCSKRKRVVIHKGCAYGAPFYISKVTHTKGGANAEQILDPIRQDIESEDSLFDSAITSKHQALLDLLQDEEVFIYHRADDSCSIGSEHLIKGVPAKILRYLLRAYKSESRTRFEYREFLRDYDISLGNKDPQITTPLVRVIEKLETRSRCLKIVRIGRGKFELQINGKLKFSEE